MMFVQHLHSITLVYMFVFILLLACQDQPKKHEQCFPFFFKTLKFNFIRPEYGKVKNSVTRQSILGSDWCDSKCNVLVWLLMSTSRLPKLCIEVRLENH